MHSLQTSMHTLWQREQSNITVYKNYHAYKISSTSQSNNQAFANVYMYSPKKIEVVV